VAPRQQEDDNADAKSVDSDGPLPDIVVGDASESDDGSDDSD
jgi:hypothetical protein